MRNARPLSLLALVAAAGACGGESNPTGITETHSMIEIDHYRVPCVGEAASWCARIRSVGEAAFELSYDGIEGFVPAWGHTYTIEIATRPEPEVLADGPSEHRRLVRVLRDQPVAAGTTFSVTMPSPGPGLADLVTVDGGTEGNLLDGTPFVCASAEVCASLRTGLAQGANVTLMFGYARDTLLPLTLTAATPMPRASADETAVDPSCSSNLPGRMAGGETVWPWRIHWSPADGGPLAETCARYGSDASVKLTVDAFDGRAASEPALTLTAPCTKGELIVDLPSQYVFHGQYLISGDSGTSPPGLVIQDVHCTRDLSFVVGAP